MAVMTRSHTEPRSDASDSIGETFSDFIDVHFDYSRMFDTLPLFLAQPHKTGSWPVAVLAGDDAILAFA